MKCMMWIVHSFIKQLIVTLLQQFMKFRQVGRAELQILKMLEKLNVSKSLGLDGLHPRILYKTRIKITTPLKLIFEASIKKEFPHDWVNANISAVYKAESPNYVTIGQLVRD